MTKARIWLGALAALTLAATPARADPPSAAIRLYVAGNFMAAAATAEQQETSSDSQAFAARALMAACLTSSDRTQTQALLDRAENAARMALQLDANSVEGRLQWALALGVRARHARIAEAVARNYAPRGRRLIEEALQRDPNNAWGHELLGAWHLEVLRRGGSAGAAAYGARLATGMAEFDRARALAPNEPIIALHYAVALLELNPDRYAARARELLDQAAAATPRDAFETHTLNEARRLAEILDRDGARAADAAARRAFV